MTSPVVVKVGGSLFDWPDLKPRLRAWLDQLPTRRLLLVPGGGRMADAVRDFDRTHQLGEEKSHWLALRALHLNARMLADLLHEPVLVDLEEGCSAFWEAGDIPILDLLSFCCFDERRPGCLPHSWSVSSDAMAARVAVVAGAAQLFLLKSVNLPQGIDWSEAGRLGFVDSYFHHVVTPTSLAVQFVNLRAGRAPTEG